MSEVNTTVETLTETELDTLVSIAIRRAEMLDDISSPSSQEAWHEVMAYEERLAELTPPSEITGGIARVGAVRAALAAGRRGDAEQLAAKYFAEKSLSKERRQAIERVFKEEEARLAAVFPALAKSGRLPEVQEWRATVASAHGVFPRAA